MSAGGFYVLDEGTKISVSVEPLPGAQGYAWTLIQNGTVLWDSYGDYAHLAKETIWLSNQGLPMDKITPGVPVQLQVKASINGSWTAPAEVSIYIFRSYAEYLQTSCAAGWARLVIGGEAQVIAIESLHVRSAPRVAGNVIHWLENGAVVTILSGPVCAGDVLFWEVSQDAIPGGSGWLAEGDGSVFWLEPYIP